MMDKYPNMLTEVGAVLAELGLAAADGAGVVHQVSGPGAVRQGHLGDERVLHLLPGV
jgi:hypothetical protein